MFWEGFTLQPPSPKTCSIGRNTGTPSWPITPRIWSSYQRKANYGTVGRSSPTITHGWIVQAARRENYISTVTTGFCNFSDEGTETTASYGWGTEKETQNCAHPCVWSHTHAVLRKEFDLSAKQPLLLPSPDTERLPSITRTVRHSAWLHAAQSQRGGQQHATPCKNARLQQT